MLKYSGFINEHKLYGKTIKQVLDWLELKSDKNWVFVDTETTGLPSDNYDVQLTQVSCIVTKYDFINNIFKEVSKFDKKIKLTDVTKDSMSNTDRIKSVLSFNHYGQKGVKYQDENDTLKEFNEFISEFKDSIFIIQNAEFDMRFLNTRGEVRFRNEVIDTKQILQYFYLPTVLKLSESDVFFVKLVNKIGTSSRDNGLISSSLSKIGPALDINMNGYHDALTDCRLLIEMLNKVIIFLKDNIDVDIRKYQHQRLNAI